MFISEKQLVKALKGNYHSICHWDTSKFSTWVLEEVDLGFGVADLVISKMHSNPVKTTTELNYFDVIIYNIVQSNKSISVQELKKITCADMKIINKSLLKLVSESYINQKDSLVTFRKSYSGISTDSIAIEAKLKNWKRALNQAFRYKWFAKKSYVVLDSAHIRPAVANIERFKQLNVGLAEIDKAGFIIMHYKPLKTDPIDSKMWILLNEVLRKSVLRKKKGTPVV